jgi:hypothetical protein
MTDVNTPRESTSCVLQHDKCGEHHGKCPNPWIIISEIHEFLHRLPGELQRLAIAETVVPQPQCIKHVFGHCYNPWECKAGTHPFDSVMPAITPLTCYTSRCQLILEEGYKAFFRGNVFVFKSHHRMHLGPQHRDPAWVREWFRSINFRSRNDRDPRATHRLDFFDLALWKGSGSPEFEEELDDGSYDRVNEHRYAIRHLVFTVGGEGTPVVPLHFQHSWAWALTVDWETLPNLKTLVLDLRGYSYRQLQGPELPEDLYNEQLEGGAKRMQCLKLKSLIIYGLCSGPEYWGKVQHRREMEKLFQPALGNLGKLELRDEERFEDW